MPRQSKQKIHLNIVFLFSSIAAATTTTAPIGPAPVGPQPTSSGAPQIVYVPRNVYVPVIKPVFVPRERTLFILFSNR